MAGVLNQIEEIQKERQLSSQETSIETKQVTPLRIMTGSYCDIDVLGGFADGRYSVIDVQLATSDSAPDYREEGFVSKGFTRYDINLKMDRKSNYYTKKPLYVHYEQNTARLEIGFEGRVYSVAVPKILITREGMITSHPGINTYRESTTTSAPMAIDI
ncbi:hypothetical protein GW830_03835 [bacterium]|nr:hypothetical protein [bacterium]